MEKKYSFNDLVDIMSKLRAQNGCPWDKLQTHDTLLPYLVEETHEFIDAAQEKDKAHMAEELGDVLFQVVFHSQVAKENGDFDINNVIDGICKKMLRRHPHVFGNIHINTATEVTQQWAQIKAKENGNKTDSIMNKVSKSLPTLSRAQELQRRAAQIGFDWETATPVFNKALEEFCEFRAELQKVTESERNIDRLEDEFGDIMFSLVNVARHSGFNAALALERANSKFEKRFRKVESIVLKNGKQMKDVRLENLQQIWEHVKKSD